MSRTILLVDDDALMQRSLAFHLEQAGYQVHTAANAEDAVSFVRHSPPDLVMLDIGLPGMDGLDALRELKAQHNLPVIFLTGRRRELDEVVRNLFQLVHAGGIRAWLSKDSLIEWVGQSCLERSIEIRPTQHILGRMAAHIERAIKR